MPFMKKGRHTRPGIKSAKPRWLSLLLALGLFAALMPMSAALADSPDTYPWSEVTNSAAWWEDVYGPTIHVPAETNWSCEKVDNDADEPGGYTLGSPPEDSVWRLLVVKAGSEINDLIWDPVVGETYEHSLQGGWSHVILCSIPDVFVPDPSLSVTKTAVASYDLTHAWDITKVADLTTVNLFTDGSGDALVTWTVDVTYEGSTISNESVTGTITLDNTGNVDAKIDSLDDALDTGEAGVVTCPEDGSFVIPAGESVDCTYTVDPDGIDATLNTATASGEFAIDEEGTFDGSSPLDEDGTAPVDFVLGTETNATVNINDLSDLFGDVDLGSVTAPNGDTFTYDKQFSYEDYGQANCGTHTYDNTASIVETGQTADETVTVNVQCLVFQGETAWAANGDTPGVFRYNNRGGNWATYVEGEGKTTTLFAGQFFDAGEVTLSDPVGGFVTITIDLDDPWEFGEDGSTLHVQTYSSAPSGNPAPGQFDYTAECPDDPLVPDICTIVVPDANYYGIHVEVGQWVPDPDFPPAA